VPPQEHAGSVAVAGNRGGDERGISHILTQPRISARVTSRRGGRRLVPRDE
jgi:hypothetical protein